MTADDALTTPDAVARSEADFRVPPHEATTKRPQVVVVTNREGQLQDFLAYLAMDHDVVMAKSRQSVLADADPGSIFALILSEQPSDISAGDFFQRLSEGNRRPANIIVAASRQSPWLAFVERQTKIDGVIHFETPVEHQIHAFGLLASRGPERRMAALGDHAKAIWQEARGLMRNIDALVRAGHPMPRSAMHALATSVVEHPDETLFLDMIGILREHHRGTLVHSLDVALNALLLGRHVGVRDKSDQYLLFEAGLVHDIGKTEVPLGILDKPGKLTAEEWAVMRQHPVASERILREAGDYDEHIIWAASQHHEKHDGSGYPNGLSSAEISEIGRLMGVCDVFCALTEKRAYKTQMPVPKAFDIMRSMTGHHLDAVLVERLIEMTRGHPSATSTMAA